MTTKLQVVFYSMYGHVYRMAEALEKSGAKTARPYSTVAFATVT